MPSLDLLPQANDDGVRSILEELPALLKFKQLDAAIRCYGDHTHIATLATSDDAQQLVKVQSCLFSSLKVCDAATLMLQNWQSGASNILEKLKVAYLYLQDGFPDLARSDIDHIAEDIAMMEKATDKCMNELEKTMQELKVADDKVTQTLIDREKNVSSMDTESATLPQTNKQPEEKSHARRECTFMPRILELTGALIFHNEVRPHIAHVMGWTCKKFQNALKSNILTSKLSAGVSYVLHGIKPRIPAFISVVWNDQCIQNTLDITGILYLYWHMCPWLSQKFMSMVNDATSCSRDCDSSADVSDHDRPGWKQCLLGVGILIYGIYRSKLCYNPYWMIAIYFMTWQRCSRDWHYLTPTVEDRSQQEDQTASPMTRHQQELLSAKNDLFQSKLAAMTLSKAGPLLKGCNEILMTSLQLIKKWYDECKTIVEPNMATNIQRAENLSEEDAQKYWRSLLFEENAVRYYERWTALRIHCENCRELLRTTRSSLEAYYTENLYPAHAVVRAWEVAADIHDEDIDKIIEEREQNRLLVHWRAQTQNFPLRSQQSQLSPS